MNIRFAEEKDFNSCVELDLHKNVNIIKNKITIILGNDKPENILSANQYQNQIPEIEIIGIDHAKMLPHVEKSDEFIEIVKPLLEK